MTRRYFTTQLPQNSHLTLTDSEAHHFLHVMRGNIGDEILLFNGAGQEWLAKVRETSRREVITEIVSEQTSAAELERQLSFAIALPKGDRQKWLIEKLTELGIHQLTPVLTERTESRLKIDKLQRVVIEACKQSGRSTFMQINEPETFSQYVDKTDNPSELCIIAHPLTSDSAPSSGQSLSTENLIRSNSVKVLIGPEGGFTESEVQRAVDAGWQAVSLGPTILRIETAAVSLAGWLRIHDPLLTNKP